MLAVVADASSVILLAKCGLLRTYSSRVTLIVPRQVMEEAAARELWETYPDAEEIARCAADDLLRVRSGTSAQELPIALGAGEAAAIRLFLEEKADLLLSDDRRALIACRLLAIPFTTTPRVIVDLRASGTIPPGQARRALEKIAVVGRYSREVVAAAMVALQEIRDDETDDNPSA